MEWMSPIDSSFLHVENAITPMHIGGVSIFAGPPPPFEDLRAIVEGKLGLVPRYRQKVRMAPLAVGSPAWIDDPQFNLDFGVLAAGIERGMADLLAVVSPVKPAPRKRARAAPRSGVKAARNGGKPASRKSGRPAAARD